MLTDITFYIESLLLGVGLAMDAFSVSIADGLSEPCMKKRKMAVISSVFGLFQLLMPLAGWFCVHAFVESFKKFEKFIPWIALVLLLYIGGKMIFEGIKGETDNCSGKLTVRTVLIQSIATAIDALSVGFTIADYKFIPAFVECLIIGITTTVICLIGFFIGKKVGNKLSSKATFVGGIILVLIGIEIFLKGIL